MQSENFNKNNYLVLRRRQLARSTNQVYQCMAELTTLLFTCRDSLQVNPRTVKVRRRRAITRLVDFSGCACVESLTILFQDKRVCFLVKSDQAPLKESSLEIVYGNLLGNKLFLISESTK